MFSCYYFPPLSTTMNQYTDPSTNNHTSPPPPRTTSSSPSSSSLRHPFGSHQSPFPALTKPFDPPPSHRPSTTYPPNLTLPSAIPPPQPTSAISSLQQKQLKAQTIERPWPGMPGQQPSPNDPRLSLHSNSDRSSSSVSHSSPSLPTSILSPLARWRAEPGVQGPYNAIARMNPVPHTSTSPRTRHQGHAPSRASTLRGSRE